jgi:hypothetical protein
MVRSRLWTWETFDRCVGIFAAACAFAGAYFTYKAAFPPVVPAGSPASAPMTSAAAAAGAPWWALALLGLSAILLIVSLTRSRKAAVVDLEELEERVDWIFKRQRDHVSTPELAKRLENEIAAVIAGTYLLRYAQESAWREDNRRVSNGEQARTVAHLAMKRGPSVDFSGYWQRHSKAA